jgi:hypothetical protein
VPIALVPGQTDIARYPTICSTAPGRTTASISRATASSSINRRGVFLRVDGAWPPGFRLPAIAAPL